MQEILVYDENGEILDSLTQWDFGINVRIKKSDVSEGVVDYIHYFNTESKRACVVEVDSSDNDYYTALIPSVLLQQPYPIFGYIKDQVVGSDDAITKERALYMFRITVKKQPKPSDREYEDTQEYLYLEAILEECQAAVDAADRAEQAAAKSGYMHFYIDGNGCLIYEKTSNVDVDFSLENGDLILTTDNLV